MITSGGAGDTPERMDAVEAQVRQDEEEFLATLPRNPDGSLDKNAIQKMAEGQG